MLEELFEGKGDFDESAVKFATVYNEAVMSLCTGGFIEIEKDGFKMHFDKEEEGWTGAFEQFGLNRSTQFSTEPPIANLCQYSIFNGSAKEKHTMVCIDFPGIPSFFAEGEVSISTYRPEAVQ